MNCPMCNGTGKRKPYPDACESCGAVYPCEHRGHGGGGDVLIIEAEAGTFTVSGSAGGEPNTMGCYTGPWTFTTRDPEGETLNTPSPSTGGADSDD